MTSTERGGAYAKPVSPARVGGGNSGAAAYLRGLAGFVANSGHVHADTAAFVAKLSTVICAWCGSLMRMGDGQTSHGICPACEREFEAQVDGGSRHDGPEASEVISRTMEADHA